MLPTCCCACGIGAASATWLHRDTAVPAGWLQHHLCILGYLRLPLQGVKNNLAMKHVPWVLPRNDTLAGGCQPAAQAPHSAAGRGFEQPPSLLAVHPTNSPLLPCRPARPAWRPGGRLHADECGGPAACGPPVAQVHRGRAVRPRRELHGPRGLLAWAMVNTPGCWAAQ